MRNRIPFGSALVSALIAGSPGLAAATDGHFLHGVGAVNSAMGGVAVARSNSILGALYTNPAGLARFAGRNIEIGLELFKPDRTLSSAVGGAHGSTRSSSSISPIPSIGWTQSLRDGKIVLGIGVIGAGGFGVDYSSSGTNPILAPRPYGFGDVYSNFMLLKVVPAVAINATPRLRIGIAANADWASLAVDPMPVASPAVDPGPDGIPYTADDRAYYSRARDAAGAFGVGFQAGLQYAFSSALAVGASYVSPQKFQKFEYNSVWENPNLPNYNTARTITFALDVPAVYAAGLALTPSSSVTAGLDAKYITYSSTRGFKDSGFAPDGSVRGFGWENIWSVASGVELQATKQLKTRLGYNFSQNPIPDALSMFNMPAPAVVQHHATVGVGYVTAGGFGIDLGYYRAFRHSITGPFQSMSGAMAGTSVTSSLAENSFLIGFSYGSVTKK